MLSCVTYGTKRDLAVTPTETSILYYSVVCRIFKSKGWHWYRDVGQLSTSRLDNSTSH